MKLENRKKRLARKRKKAHLSSLRAQKARKPIPVLSAILKGLTQ